MNEVNSFVIISLCIPIVLVPSPFLFNQNVSSLEFLFSKCVVILNLKIKCQLKTKSFTYCEFSSALKLRKINKDIRKS